MSRLPVLALSGATGFVGQAVLDEADRRGMAVRALTRRPQPSRHGIDWVIGSLGDAEALDQLMQGADAVLHVAGLTNAPDAAGFKRANVTGTEAILRAAENAGVQRFVFVSSLSAREPQLSAYGNSKARAEALVAATLLDWTIVRPPAIYGPRDTEMFELFRAASYGLVPLPPRGRASLIAVQDLASLLIGLAATKGQRETLEPDDGHPQGYSHAQIARLMGEAFGKRVLGVHFPKGVLQLAAKVDRLVRGDKAKLTSDRVGYMSHPDWVCDPVKAPARELWTAQIAAPEGMAATAQWYRDNGWL